MSTYVKFYLEYRKTAQDDWHLFAWNKKATDPERSEKKCPDDSHYYIGYSNYTSFKQFIAFEGNAYNERCFPKDMSNELKTHFNECIHDEVDNYSWNHSFITLEELYKGIEECRSKIVPRIKEYFENEMYGMFKKFIEYSVTKKESTLKELNKLIKQRDEDIRDDYYVSLEDIYEEYTEEPNALSNIYHYAYNLVENTCGFVTDSNIRLIFYYV